jgi:hypothetical protein
MMLFTRGRRRTVDTSGHFCPDQDCSYHGWLGRGNIRSNGLRAASLGARLCADVFKRRQLELSACHCGSFRDRPATTQLPYLARPVSLIGYKITTFSPRFRDIDPLIVYDTRSGAPSAPH